MFINHYATPSHAYPRTNLSKFKLWQTFAANIHTAITDVIETQDVAVGMRDSFDCTVLNLKLQANWF
jgi:hypothetical protein